MAGVTRHSPETKAKALAIADAVSITEAAKETGVPAGTIKRWRSEANRTAPTEPNRTPKKLKDLQQQAVERAVEEAGDYILNRLKTLADGLYDLAEEGLTEVREFLRDPRRSKDRDSAAWLKAVVGAMHYGIQDAQLLSGKPTARPEVTERHVYDITQRIVQERPELLDAIFAENPGSGLEDRRG